MPQPAPAPHRMLRPADVLAELLDAAEHGPMRWTAAPGGTAAMAGALPVSYWALAEPNGAEFVQHAFTELLGRKPDQGALDYYTAALASGDLAKPTILGLIRYSKEGRRIGKIVPGLRARFALLQLHRLPLVGRLVRVASAALMLPRLVRDLQRLEQAAHADHARLERLERALAASGPQLGVRVGHAEVRLQELGSVDARLAALEQRLGTTPEG